MPEVKTETFHEAWDCSGCGIVGLSAYNCKQCPSCGAPLDEEGVYRTQEPVDNYQFKGRDIICAHCETRNEKRFSCRNCGASLTDDDDEQVKAFVYKSNSDGQPISKRVQSRSTRTRRTNNTNALGTTNVKNDSRRWWLIAGCCAVFAILCIAWVVIQARAVIPVTLTADRAHWSYHLSLEDYQPRQKTLTVEEGTFGSPPTDAYNVTSNRVFIRFEPVYVWKTIPKTCTSTSSRSNGDGTWSQTTTRYDCSYRDKVKVGDDDIWGTRYEYTVDRWEAIPPLTKEGWDQKPRFPTFTTPSHCLSSQPTHGCVRAVSEPKTIFTIHFFYYDEEEREDVSTVMSRDIWESIRLGSDYPALVNGFGNIQAVKGIHPEYESLRE